MGWGAGAGRLLGHSFLTQMGGWGWLWGSGVGCNLEGWCGWGGGVQVGLGAKVRSAKFKYRLKPFTLNPSDLSACCRRNQSCKHPPRSSRQDFGSRVRVTALRLVFGLGGFGLVSQSNPIPQLLKPQPHSLLQTDSCK